MGGDAPSHDTLTVVSHLWPKAVLLASLLTIAGSETSTAAPPQTLGQNPISTEGGCTLCSVVQLSNSASPNTYVFPADGVLTKARFYVGSLIEASDFAQARVFRKTGGSSVSVISQGQKRPLFGLSTGAHSFFERIPGSAGDVLGARFDSSPNVNGTPHIFTTASALDEAGFISTPVDPEVGDPFTSTPIANRRVNVSALYEPDEDHDGYGDTSQDLCPGSPVAATACSGSLFGSDFQGAFNQTGVDCTYACLRVQESIGGASTAAPFAGVVVRWRLLSAPGGAYRIRVLSPSGGPNHRITASSPSESVAVPGSIAKITTFQTRLPIPAGGYVGLVPPTFTPQPYREPTPGSTYVQVNDGPEGTETNLSSFSGLTREVLYNADIEPDADGDGFGDLTQDACSTDGSTQAGCPAPPSAATSTPTIRGFKAGPQRFRVAPRGAVVSGVRAPAGTTLRLTLSEAANVAFAVERRVNCRNAPKPKRCAPWKRVHSFARRLAAGAGSVRYSGRFRQRARRGSLVPGGYRITAVATNATGVSSAAARTRMTVVR